MSLVRLHCGLEVTPCLTLCVVLFQVLCLHLKRFHWTAFLRNKVDTYVEFPLHSLDMRAFLLEVRGTRQ